MSRGPQSHQVLSQIVREAGLVPPQRVTSTKRNGSGASWHNSGHAIDMAGRVPARSKTADMDAIFNFWAQYGSRLHELIYAWMPFNIKNGRRVNPYAVSTHRDHVHIAASKANADWILADVRRKGGTPTPTPDPVGSDEEMKRGDSGGQVAWLQRRLNYVNRNQSGLRLTDDGQFGPTTERVVKEVQKRWSHAQTGRADVGLVGRLLDVELSDRVATK